VRELPNEWAIEHGCHCDEHEANDEPGPRSGFAVLLSCVHDRPSIAQRSRNGRARDSAPRRGQDWKDPCPDSAGAPGSSFLAAPCWRDPSHMPSDGEGSTLRTSPDQGTSMFDQTLCIEREPIFDRRRRPARMVGCRGR